MSMPHTPRIVSLNPDTVAYNDEAIIDVFTAGIGGYCGSFTISKREITKFFEHVESDYRVFVLRK